MPPLTTRLVTFPPTAPRLFVRWIFPAHSPCPHCGCRQYHANGQHGRTAYRRCHDCRRTFKVAAAHAEVATDAPAGAIVSATEIESVPQPSAR